MNPRGHARVYRPKGRRLNVALLRFDASGAIASTLADTTLAAAGSVANVGTLASTLADVLMAAAGIAGDNATGTIASTLAGVTMMATGQSDTPIVMSGAIMRRRARPRIPPRS